MLLYINLFAGVQLYGGPRSSPLLNITETKSFHLEYGSLACTVEIVDDVFAAIDHIHQHGRQACLFLLDMCFDFTMTSLISYKSLYLFPVCAVLILIALLQKTLKLLKLSYVKLIGICVECFVWSFSTSANF